MQNLLMKYILLSCFLLGLVCVGFAQEKKRRPIGWDIAVSPGVPLKNYHWDNRPQFAWGFETRIQQNFGYNFAWMASLGYTQFENVEIGFICLKGGIKAYLDPKVYLGAEVGIGEEIDGGEVFIFSPSVGMLFGKRWDLSLKYESFADFNNPFIDNQLALRIGFRLK
jgi:hypothetical protein